VTHHRTPLIPRRVGDPVARAGAQLECATPPCRRRCVPTGTGLSSSDPRQSPTTEARERRRPGKFPAPPMEGVGAAVPGLPTTLHPASAAIHSEEGRALPPILVPQMRGESSTFPETGWHGWCEAHRARGHWACRYSAVTTRASPWPSGPGLGVGVRPRLATGWHDRRAPVAQGWSLAGVWPGASCATHMG